MEMWYDHTGADERGVHRKRARGATAESGVAIDLTPMLDVVMIMLIFFIVAGSFVREIVIEVEHKPAATSESDAPSENILIQISATDEVWIKGRRIDLRSVRANISRLKAEFPKASVVIKAHNKSTVHVVAGVADAAREAGIFNVALNTGN